MAKYVWTAKDGTGQTVVKEILAATTEEARSNLLAQGYSDLVLKEDEIMSIARAGFEKQPSIFGEEVQVTAEDRIKHQNDPTRGYLACVVAKQ